jgi:hypothetical protein
MRSRVGQAFAVIAIILAAVSHLAAKGPTVQLVITEGGLTAPIIVTDASILSDSNVFGDAFLGAIANPRSIDRTWPKYVVSFFVELPAWMRQGVQKKYVVYYARHPKTGEGFVYLPAPTEEWYGLNASTILRNGLEGNWLRAPERWSRALNARLP